MDTVTDNQTGVTERSIIRNAYVCSSLFLVDAGLSDIVNFNSSWHGITCGLCGCDIKDISFKAKVYNSKNHRNQKTISFCSNCFNGDYSEIERFKHTCEVCNKTVYAIMFNGTCGEHCRQHKRYKKHRTKLKALEPQSTCAICSTQFTPNRTDSRYCSNKCRQKAYRLRSKE